MICLPGRNSFVKTCCCFFLYLFSLFVFYVEEPTVNSITNVYNPIVIRFL